MAQTCAKLASNAVIVGIDVSKDHLDAAQYPSGDLIQTSNDTSNHPARDAGNIRRRWYCGPAGGLSSA
ncbi:hypothetical protein ACSW3B_18615, partial [Acetobacter senegalensis]